MILKAVLTNEFKKHFNCSPDMVIRAPGRVNLIGEHTDYNDGFVFPCAIDYATYVAVSPRNDDLIQVIALDYQNEVDEIHLNKIIQPHISQSWANYVRGVVNEFQARKYPISGCNMIISGDVPQGAGLSSSASLEVGIAEAINRINNLHIKKKEIALIAQAAENNFVGCACGIMDQLISACGKEGAALAIDCRSLSFQESHIPDAISIILINSNVKRGLVESEYNIRRAQCEYAAKHFNVSHLRDVSIAQFEREKHGLDVIVAKRAQHIIYENQRTLDAVSAFDTGDLTRVGELMAKSHESMRTLFEITTPQIDFIVELVLQIIGTQGGVRMTGGGFGGCVVAVVPDSLVARVVSVIEANYENHTGIKENIYITRPAQGVGIV